MSQPTHVLVQLSDLHIVPEGGLLHDRVDTLANVEAALDAVERSGVRPAALLLTGDLADAGDVPSYERLKAVVEPAAARIGAPVLYGMGNHDVWSGFRAGLLGTPEADGPHDLVHWFGDLRVIMMDSTVPGEPHGELTDDQLGWLRAELDTPAAGGTILALHHPPVASPIVLINRMLLREPRRLAEVVGGSDVRMILAGHAHHASAGVLAGVPVWVATATAYEADVLAPGDGLRGLVGGAYTRVDVYQDSAVATLVPVTKGELVYELSAELMNAYLAASPEERAAAVRAENETGDPR